MALPGDHEVIPHLSTAQSRDPVRSLSGKIGGYSTQLRYGDAVAARAREGLWGKFVREADPDSSLSPEMREKRARQLMGLHMAAMALASVQARLRSGKVRNRRKSAQVEGAPTPENGNAAA